MEHMHLKHDVLGEEKKTICKDILIIGQIFEYVWISMIQLRYSILN